MKNFNDLLENSDLLELNTDEMSSIIGGGWWQDIKAWLKGVWEDIEYAYYEYTTRPKDN
jgi:bacteriocin-like protein